MGGPTDTLVPPAVLFLHPKGLTFEKFYKKVQEISLKVGAGSLDLRTRNEYEFADQILNLSERKEYLQLKESFFDPHLDYYKRYFFERDLSVIHSEYTPTKNLIEFEVEVEGNSKNFEGYLPKNYLEELNHFFFAKGIPQKFRRDNIKIRIEEVLEESAPIQEDYKHWTKKQKLKGRIINVQEDKEKFSTRKKLVSKYPEYELKEIYNFSGKRNELFPTSKKGTRIWINHKKRKTFFWIKRDEKYFLDIPFMKDNFSPNSVYTRDANSHHTAYSHIAKTEEWRYKSNGAIYSWTDFVLTCEAIKRKNWKLLKYSGNRYELLPFLYSKKKIFKIYEKAILDTEQSIDAKNKGITNTKFLRNYIFMKGKFTPLNFPRAKKNFGEYVKKEKKEREEWEKRWREEMKEWEKEFPF